MHDGKETKGKTRITAVETYQINSEIHLNGL
jgi:hypothetical protein